MDKSKFKVLAEFSSGNKARLMKSLLDSMGIESQIVNQSAVMPFLENDVRILVNEGDYEKAKEIMNAKFDKSDFKPV